jgi:hypothetical protein
MRVFKPSFNQSSKVSNSETQTTHNFPSLSLPHPTGQLLPLPTARTTRIMSLDTLPAELMGLIYLDNAIGQQERYNLTCVSRWLHEITLPVLYRSIKLHISESEYSMDREESNLSLERTLHKNAKLGDSVQCLDLSWGRVSSRRIIPKHLFEPIKSILRRVPNLKHLALKVIGEGQDPNDVDTVPMLRMPFSIKHLHQLRSLELVGMSLLRPMEIPASLTWGHLQKLTLDRSYH